MCRIKVRFSQSSQRRGVFNYALKVEVTDATGISSKIFVYHQSPAGPEGNTFAEFDHIATPVDFQEIPEDAASETVPWYRTDKCTVWFRNVSDMALAKQLFVDDINALTRTYNVLTSENGFSRQTSVEFSDNGVHESCTDDEDTIEKEIDAMKKDISEKVSKDAMSGVEVETNTTEGIRNAVREIGNTLGAKIMKTVVLALSALSIGTSALGAGFSGEHFAQIDLDENPLVVTNVTFDGLATIVDITNVVDSISTNFVPMLRKEIADASNAGTNYVDSATNDVLSASKGYTDSKTGADIPVDATQGAQTISENLLDKRDKGDLAVYTYSDWTVEGGQLDGRTFLFIGSDPEIVKWETASTRAVLTTYELIFDRDTSAWRLRKKNMYPGVVFTITDSSADVLSLDCGDYGVFTRTSIYTPESPDDTLARISDIPSVVAPSSSATAGQAADAKATGDALAGKADKPATFTAGNLAKFDANGNPVDAEISADEIVTESEFEPVANREFLMISSDRSVALAKDAVESAYPVETSHNATEAGNTCYGFSVNLKSYLEEFAGSEASDISITKARIQSVTVRLRNLTNLAKLAVKETGTSDVLALSDPLQLRNVSGGQNFTFLFTDVVVLPADMRYDFYVVDASSGDVLTDSRMGVVSTPKITGLELLNNNGTRSSYNGAWGGGITADCIGLASIRIATETDLSCYVPTNLTINGKALSSDVTLTADDIDYSVSGGSQSVQMTLEGIDAALDGKATKEEATLSYMLGEQVHPGYEILSLTTNITEEAVEGGVQYTTNISSKVHYVNGGWDFKLPKILDELSLTVMTNTSLVVGEETSAFTNLDFVAYYDYVFKNTVKESEPDVSSFKITYHVPETRGLIEDRDFTPTKLPLGLGSACWKASQFYFTANNQKSFNIYTSKDSTSAENLSFNGFNIDGINYSGISSASKTRTRINGIGSATTEGFLAYGTYENEQGIHFAHVRIIGTGGETLDTNVTEFATAASTNQLFSAISTLEEQIDTESPLLARSYAIEQQEGWTYNRANGSTIYFRPQYFGMNNGDLFKGIIVRTKDVNLTPFTSVYMRLKRYSDGAILGVSDAVVYPNTANTDVVFSFPQAITLPSKDNYYSIDFSETPGGEAISQFGMRIYVLSSGANPECYFHISSYVPVMTVQFYSFAEVVAPTAEATTGQLADAKDTYDALTRKADKPATFTTGNLTEFDANGNLVDSHKSLDDISQEIQDALQYAVVVDDKLVPVDGPGSEEVFYNGGDAATYLAEHLPSWTCNGTDQGAVLRNRYGFAPEYYHYDLSLFTDRIVFWVEGQEGGAYGAFTRSIVFPKSGVYSIDIEYAAGYDNYPDALGQALFVVDAGTSGPQDVIGVNDQSIVQTAHLQFVANDGNGSIVIKGKTGLSWPSCCVVISSVKVTLVKEIGIEIGDIVAPDASAQTGQAADAAATYNQLAGKVDSTENVSWEDLKLKRDNGELVPGSEYRITNYWATSNGDMNSRAVTNQFDIIVVADATNVLNETARAIRHDGDTYFPAETKFEAWRMQYCINNDTNRFAWAVADADGGRGVIYRMVDEFNNDVPYDFKGIQFLAYGDTDNVYRYTFDSGYESDNVDYSTLGIVKWVYGNTMGEVVEYNEGSMWTNRKKLNRNVFKGEECYSNIFGVNCSENTFTSCCLNKFVSDCTHNRLGYRSAVNVFKSECNYNLFGEYCQGIELGNLCEHIEIADVILLVTFGDTCDHILFGNPPLKRPYYRYITVESGNRYIRLDAPNTSNTAWYQNVTIKAGVNNTTTFKTITDTNTNQTFHTTYQPKNSQVIEVE